MAGTLAKAVRRAGAIQRLSDRLGVQQADLQAQARGDTELAMIMTLERVADALDAKVQAQERGDLRSVIAAASDDDLIDIPGIGEKSLEALRLWANEQPESTEDTPPVTTETVEAKPMETTETVEIVSASDDGNAVDVNLDAISDDVDKVDLPDGSTLERNKPKSKNKP